MTKPLWRYWRRYALRPLLWLWCLVAVLLVIVLAEIAFKLHTGWGVVAVLIAWGIYAITDAIKSRETKFISYIHADMIDASNATFKGDVLVKKEPV